MVKVGVNDNLKFFYKASTNSVNHLFIQFKGDRRIFAQVQSPWATYILLRKRADIIERIFTDLPNHFDKEYIPGAFPFKISIINIRYNGSYVKTMKQIACQAHF